MWGHLIISKKMEACYNNTGNALMNSLNQIVEQAYASLDDFKYNCYYGSLNQ